jgi:hypothetical protein
MHVTVLSKVLELAVNLAYWTALWLLAKLFGRGTEPEAIEAGGEHGRVLEDSVLKDTVLEDTVREDRVLTVRASRRRATVVIVRTEEGADDVIVSIGVIQ